MVQDVAICTSHKTCLPRAVKICDLNGAYGLLDVKKDELAGRLFVREEIVELDVVQIVPHRLDMGMVLHI